ncbi:MAG: hypothetical protein IPL46_26555 [Saprospiraceae bacterium]|nr:hypothetical protein [Saprospiraceae bacterium]
MSQFDLPRLNFSGKFSVDPATGNNNTYHPILIYNPLDGKAFFPPRIYIDQKYVASDSTLEKVIECVPDGVELKTDNDSLFSGVKFIEVDVIDTPEKFIHWSRTPLGQWAEDQAFHGLYDALHSPNFGNALTGLIVGYWNYYGTNLFHLHDVTIRSVTIDQEGKPATFYGNEKKCPKAIKPFLGAKLTYNAVPDDDSTNSARIVDTLPVMNVYSQIFSDLLTLIKEDKILFKGNPNKASLRQVNVFRVVNSNMPYSGAGKFITTIPLQSLQKKEASEIITFFKKTGTRRKKLKGIYIQQILSEIEARRPMDYTNLGNLSNPAFGTISGTIAPWYEGEMRSWTIARQLCGVQPFENNKNKDYDISFTLLTPAVYQVYPELGRLDIDLSVNIPMENTKDGGPILANPYEINHYKTYELGQVDLIFEKIDPEGKPVDKLAIGTLTINQDVLPRKKVLEEGGIFSLFFNPNAKPREFFMESNLTIFGNDDSSQKIRLMQETPDVILSDETGLYCDQNDDPVKGYYTYTGTKEPCRIRIFRYGMPVTIERDIWIREYKISIGGAEMEINHFRTAKYKDGDVISFPTDRPSSTIYQFLTQKPTQTSLNFYPISIVKTGFFVNMRVLPTYDHSIYLDPSHENYAGPVTFDILTKEIFSSYHLLYPIMNFSNHSWDNKAMAKFLFERIRIEAWGKPWYMPVGRDLSETQRSLILAWINNILKSPETENVKPLIRKPNKEDLSHRVVKRFFIK